MTEPNEKRTIGPFQLEDKLGVGGMGIVYRATYLKTGQKVAVKVLAPDLIGDKKVAARFEREMDILKKLKHPNIVKYYGGSSTAAQRFYAMELITGGSLDDLLKKRKQLTWEETIEFGLQVAQALEYAHNAGIIHRDLKPGNLLLTQQGVLKLSDFGIARDTQVTALTAAGKTVGTMAYMAPEQITGKHPITRKTDLYALGCVLFELLSGRTPFVAATSPELLFKHVDEDPPPVREFNANAPVWLEQLIQSLLEKDPADRPHDALAVQVKLQEIRDKVAAQQSVVAATIGAGAAAVTIRDGAVTATKIGGKVKKKSSSRQRPPFWERAWFLLLVLFAVIGVTVWGLWPASESERFIELQTGIAAAPEAGESIGEFEVVIAAFLADFPESKHRAQVSAWMDEVRVEEAERQATSTAKWNRDPRNEGERSYLEARRYETVNDRVTAIVKYRAMKNLFLDHPELKQYAVLAQRRLVQLEPQGELQMFVRNEIIKADKVYAEGDPVGAKIRWESLVALYGDKQEFAVLMEAVQERIKDPQAIETFPVSPTAAEVAPDAEGPTGE